MKARCLSLAAAAALMLGGVGTASADMELAKTAGCTACHAVDTKVVGPAFKDVNARYAGNGDARAALIEKVKKGGKGNWTDVTGGVPMPPYSPRVSDADIEKLVDFVLNM